jgi:hypothetical protein
VSAFIIISGKVSEKSKLTVCKIMYVISVIIWCSTSLIFTTTVLNRYKNKIQSEFSDPKVIEVMEESKEIVLDHRDSFDEEDDRSIQAGIKHTSTRPDTKE